ncbi:MAG TPA: extradiol ring-cleavage dioxygenase, partial [Chloroflexota bacterium]|nr:extradiol ring-cleavage dioxygenase [Chloroflexota bacterium]
LKNLASGTPEKLTGLYTVDSDTMRGGTGEIRNWLVVAGAMGNHAAQVVDYIPAYHAVTGLGFAYWPVW